MPQPKTKVPETVFDIPRNDVAACVAFYKSRRGQLRSEEMQMMQRLQDDDAEFLRVAAGWTLS